MKHSDFTRLYDRIALQESKELIEAVKAHGGEYVFIHLDNNNEVIDHAEIEGAPIVTATHQWYVMLQDHYVSRIKVSETNGVDELQIYGWLVDPGWPDEYLITDVAYGHRSSIMDLIPETATVSDVAISSPEP